MLTAPTAALAARLARVRADMRTPRPRRPRRHPPAEHGVPQQLRRQRRPSPSSTAARLYLLTDFRYAAAVHDLLASSVCAAGHDVRPGGGLLRGGPGGGARALRGAGRRARDGFAALEAGRVVARAARGAAGASPRSVPATGRALVATDGVVETRADVQGRPRGRGASGRPPRGCPTWRGACSTSGRARRAAPSATSRRTSTARMKRAGFSRPAFDTIVASGPNSALPHAHPTGARGGRRRPRGAGFRRRARRLLRGPDAHGGDRATSGREQRRLYAAVREAQRRAIAAVGEGGCARRRGRRGRARLPGDARAWPRRSATAPGTASGSRCTRSRGWASAATKGPPPAVLEAGMVCTIEPGVYVAGYRRGAARGRHPGRPTAGATCSPTCRSTRGSTE